MLLFVYNFVQILLLTITWPFVLTLVLLTPKYRNRIRARMGITLFEDSGIIVKSGPTIWIHALSVGEVTSATPLVRALKSQYPEGNLFFSAGTESGEKIANDLFHNDVDHIFSSPLDLYPVVQRFLNRINPDLFILVETDFWPNWLLMMKSRKIPTLLVNGRVSQNSLANYKKFPLFFTPLFNSFELLTMQTKKDVATMIELGVPEHKLFQLGNLKLDHQPRAASSKRTPLADLLPTGKTIITAGSTHRGEEEMVFKAYSKVRKSSPDVFLVIAPRKPERAREILELSTKFQLQGQLRTDDPPSPTDFLLLDTIGELIELYRLSDLAFVGGSLVREGGHNPVEPANMAIPVLFGPHMEDFAELAESLKGCGGGIEVADEKELCNQIQYLLYNNQKTLEIGQKAFGCFMAQRGVVKAHLRLVQSLL